MVLLVCLLRVGRHCGILGESVAGGGVVKHLSACRTFMLTLYVRLQNTDVMVLHIQRGL